ncbi:two-partner secretion domain-containing protein, partial [Psychrobacter alimentarius]|uniref:two-partner secretion domain-containing protein n=1 Tax=Psychrobacter alimentarius TaxID=261164 RepID=UPI00191A8DB1
MNAQCYRVIFNKARGMFMVVSEAARSQGKTSNPSEGGSSISQIAGGSQTASQINNYYQGGQLSNLRAQLLLALGLATIISTSISSSAHADATSIIADRNAAAAQQAAILKSSNGKTQVNIQTPSKAGVSRNVFSQFDVGADGAILNNSRKNAQTQLAGWVEGNPYLARGEARVILNEVNSSDPSRLSGYTEIAGGRAELVIANPAGITCAGCGFINASRTTLTTGQALMDQGKLTGFDVTGGKVRIDGDGMDSMGSDYTQIIAKTAEINAGIYAKNLDVITGSNQVSYEADAKNTVVTSKNAANNSNQTTGVALDVSALGAMYAGKIRLIGTDKGMGVTNAGSIVASAGGLQLDNNGNLINSGSLIANQGKVDIATRGHSADNSGTIASSRDTATLNSSTLNNSGVISSRNTLQLQQTGAISNSGEISTGSFDVKAAALNNSGTLLQTGSSNLTIDSSQLINKQGGIIGQDLYADASTRPSMTPSKTPPTTANNGSSVGTDDNSEPSETPALLPVITRDGNINANNLTNTGSIYSNGKINVAADSVANQGKSSLAVSTLNIADNGSASNTDSRLQLDQIDWQLSAFSNNKGQIITTGGIALDINNDIDNTQGTLASSGDITLNAKGDINNSAGLIQSSTNLRTDSSNLNNRNGKLISQGAMTINSRGDLTNAKGNISSAKDASINSKTINNDSGQITAQGTLTTNSDSLNNSGQLYGKTETQLTTTDAINNSGIIGSGGDTNLTAGSLTQTDSGSLVAGMNADGKLAKNRVTLKVTTSGDIISQGSHIATGDVQLIGSDINLTGSNTQGSHIKTVAREDMNTKNATIAATDTLTLSSANGILDNTAGNLRGGVLEIDAKRLNNTDGSLIQTGKQDLALALAEGIDNTRGEIASNSDNLTINTNLLNNSSGKIIHANQSATDDSRLSINADSVNNTAGEILSVGAQTWQIAKDIDNTAGVVQAKRFNIAAGGLNNTDGRLLAVATDKTQDSPSVQTQSQLNVSGTINNTISNTKTKDAKANKTETAKGVISSNTGSLDISARTLTNNQGQLSSLKDLTVNTNTLTNSGSLYSQDNVDITNQGVMSNTGSIAAKGDTTVNTGSLVQSATGQLIAGLNTDNTLDNTSSTLRVISTGTQR